MVDNIRLERCNRSAARLIAGISPSMELPHNLILARASLQPLISRRKVTQNLFVRKALLRRHPRHLQELLASWIPTDDVNRKRHSLRTNRLTAQLPRPRKNCLKLSPFYGAITQWNKFVHRHNPQDLPSANFISKHFLWPFTSSYQLTQQNSLTLPCKTTSCAAILYHTSSFFSFFSSFLPLQL